MVMDVAVTPSPSWRDNRRVDERAKTSQNLDAAAVPFIEEDNETWREHGKLFRANIVEADESNGGDVFAISDSCAIQRYYRVADRVLEKFLSSNIAERNELIKSYLVGNRLFKFLSVVLPTHNQYFSTDPRLEELRKDSESKLLNLLEYMEELELMIDEMEYNRYILEDLTPSKPKDNTGKENIIVCKMPQESHVANGNLFQRFHKNNLIDNNKNIDTMIATKPEIPIEHDQEKSPVKQEQCAALHSNQSNHTYRKIQGCSVKVTGQKFCAFHQTRKDSNLNINHSSNQHQILKQRIAAVVRASSNAELSTISHRSIRSFSNRPATSSSSSSNYSKRLDSIQDKSHLEFHDFSKNDSYSVDDHGLFQDTPFQPNHPEVSDISTERHHHEEDRQLLHENSEDTFVSWDADFSKFEALSCEKIEDENFAKNTSIDLLSKDPHWKKQQSERPKSLPKINEAPFSYTHSVWNHTQDHTVPLSSSLERCKLSTNERKADMPSAMSDCSSDIFSSLEDHGGGTVPVKTKIEERLERAMDPQSNVSGDTFTRAHYENSSVLEVNPPRKLVNQFRGCVRFLLD